MSNFNQLSGAIRFALLAGAASTFAAVPAFAQESEDDAATLETIEVTGSRLKRAEIEGAVPVIVIDRAQIDRLGGFAHLRHPAVLRFRQMKTLQKFSSVHPAFYNRFNQDRHLISRETYKAQRSAALAEWKTLAG